MTVKKYTDTTTPPALKEDKDLDEEIEFVANNPNMSETEIAEELGISVDAVRRRRRSARLRHANSTKTRENLLQKMQELLTARTTIQGEITKIDQQIDSTAGKLLGLPDED